MKPTVRLALLCLSAAALAAPAWAQTPAAAPASPSKNERQALEWFNLLDTNRDGRISLKEAEVGFRVRPSLRDTFRDADLNHDGYLTQQEIRTVAERRRAERQARRQREATQKAAANSAAAQTSARATADRTAAAR